MPVLFVLFNYHPHVWENIPNFFLSKPTERPLLEWENPVVKTTITAFSAWLGYTTHQTNRSQTRFLHGWKTLNAKR